MYKHKESFPGQAEKGLQLPYKYFCAQKSAVQIKTNRYGFPYYSVSTLYGAWKSRSFDRLCLHELKSVIQLFSGDKEVVLLGSQYIRGYIWDCIFAGVHFSFSGYFCAYGKSEISFVHNLIAILCVRIPGVYLTSKIFPDTLFPMGLATVAGSLTSVVICLIAFHILKRQKKVA